MKNPSSLLNNGFTLLGAGRKNDDWFLKRCSVRPAHKWRTQPVGGEVRAEVWPCLFDEPGCAPKGQEFDRCVAVKLRNLRDHECVLVHCERGFRRVTLPPLEPDGKVAKWFSRWRRAF